MDLAVFDPTLFAIYFVACAAAGATGGAFPPGAWYETLAKPSWTPPDWLFPLAWTVLYLSMSWAGMRVSLALEGVGGEAASGVARYAPALWALQIALNTLWTPIFFGLQRIGGALVVIGLLWAAVAACTAVFFMVDTVSGWLFTPYLAWVSYAAALNAAIYARNPAGRSSAA